ncbi:MAG: hypothetical protein WA705_03095 [Candidatus Ozemobacteraceae bacterium]
MVCNLRVFKVVVKSVKFLALLLFWAQIAMNGTASSAQVPGSLPERISEAREPASWSWEITLIAGKDASRPASLPSQLGSATLLWLPEIDVEGKRLGWNLTLGDPLNNLLIDASIAHGPQPYQFYGWQFLPVQEGSLGLDRSWKLASGTLRALVLDYAVDKVVLSRLRVRLEWVDTVH